MRERLEQVLAEAPEDLFLADGQLRDDALQQVKHALDPIAQKYSVLDAVHLDGLDAEQVWTQAQMIVDGAVEKLFSRLSEMAPAKSDGDAASDASDASDALSASEDDMVDSDAIDAEPEKEEISDPGAVPADSDDPVEIGQDNYEESSLENEGSPELENDIAEEESESYGAEHDEEDAEEGPEEDVEEDLQVNDDVKKLNSGLFRLADFQQQVLQLEDEQNGDDIDYFAHPGQSSSDEELRYQDFFAPPRKKRRELPRRPQGELNGDSMLVEKDPVEAAVSVANKDLFEDSASEAEADGPDRTTEKLSRFEKQQLDIEHQIRELEDENVGVKHWAVTGEVKAKQRPQDSLVNTEVEFDRGTKPVPIITQDVTTSLEDLIRERIKKQQFDDLPRRLPVSDVDKRASRELPEVQETKSQKSLADLYEEDQQRAQNPEFYRQQETQAMDAAHKEVIDMYTSVARKLDALCSWHYTPKAPQSSIQIVTDAPAISMEEAQPSTLSTGAMLAPQEIYKPRAGSKAEVVGRDNLPVSRSEMSTKDRNRARRRAKAQKAQERSKKEERESAVAAKTPKSTPKKDGKGAIFDTLKKGNVTVMDKRGQKRDMRGNVVKDKAPAMASHIKL